MVVTEWKLQIILVLLVDVIIIWIKSSSSFVWFGNDLDKAIDLFLASCIFNFKQSFIFMQHNWLFNSFSFNAANDAFIWVHGAWISSKSSKIWQYVLVIVDIFQRISQTHELGLPLIAILYHIEISLTADIECCEYKIYYLFAFSIQFNICSCSNKFVIFNKIQHKFQGNLMFL